MKAKRSSNIELMRIFLMFMIIFHHLIVHSLGLKELKSAAYENEFPATQAILLNSFIVIAVNAFIFISGYFGIKLENK